jgi:NADH-quinone oxidoreductase subunit K
MTTLAFFQPGLYHLMAVSIALLTAGVAVILTKRNAVGILMGVELILNAAGLNFVAFNRYVWENAVNGQMFTLFIIVLAAAEAAVALAIFLNFYNNFDTINVDQADELQG